MVEPTFHCINILGVSPDVDWYVDTLNNYECGNRLITPPSYRTEDWDAQYSPFIFVPTVRSFGPDPGLSCTLYA